MKIFKDDLGKDWELAVNVSTNKRVKALTGGAVDLFAVLDGDLLKRLTADPELLVNVIYVLCKPEAERRGVGEEEFGALLVGDAIDRATTALVEDLTDFFPLARRVLIRRAVTKVAEIETAAIGRATAKLDEMNVAELVRTAFGDFATGSPASAASTPTPGR
jgi:hypothetical protein